MVLNIHYYYYEYMFWNFLRACCLSEDWIVCIACPGWQYALIGYLPPLVYSFIHWTFHTLHWFTHIAILANLKSICPFCLWLLFALYMNDVSHWLILFSRQSLLIKLSRPLSIMSVGEPDYLRPANQSPLFDWIIITY